MSALRILAFSSLLLGMELLNLRYASAQLFGFSAEKTWTDTIEGDGTLIDPVNLRILSIQISKLPRNTFGHGIPPNGRGFLSSFLAASGTGIYGVFEMEIKGDMKFVEGSIESFVDEVGTDLTKNPGGGKIDDFFDDNKSLVVEWMPEQSRTIFIVRGYTTPARGARLLKARANLHFLTFTNEINETATFTEFGKDESTRVGPITIVSAKVGETQTQPFRRSRSPGQGNKAEWVIHVEPRSKPLKSLELIGQDGQVLWQTKGMPFDGKAYSHFIPKLEAKPKSVGAVWFDTWQKITVPLNIETGLGI